MTSISPALQWTTVEGFFPQYCNLHWEDSKTKRMMGKYSKESGTSMQPCGAVFPTLTRGKDSISDEKPASIGMDYKAVCALHKNLILRRTLNLHRFSRNKKTNQPLGWDNYTCFNEVHIFWWFSLQKVSLTKIRCITNFLLRRSQVFKKP